MTDVLNDLFNPQVKAEAENQNVTEFKPSAKKGKAGIYTAIVRFIPNPKDPSGKSIIQKYTTTLQNPLTNSWRTVDNPSTIGNPDPLVDTFFKLRNSKNAQDQEKSKNFSRRKSFASLIQVIKCEVEPQLENKILVWRYGQKIYDKIVNEMNPPMGDPRNPFDPIHGRLFNVKVVEVSGFNNYDQSEFFDLKGQNGMRVTDKNGKVAIVDDKFAASEKGRAFVLEYLNENCPDMTIYEFHPWDEETTRFVDQMIQLYTTGGMTNQTAPQATASLSEMLNSQNSQPTAQPASLDDLQIGLSAVEPTKTNNPVMDTGIDTSELDSILNSNSSSVNKGSEDLGGLGTLDDILNGNML